MNQKLNGIGFGSADAAIKIYIANRPPIDDYPSLNNLRGLTNGEIAHISKNTSNHWRKVFNVSAKFLFDWYQQKGTKNLPASWQEYRDLHLFQPHSREALLFSQPDFTDKSFHIIAGKTYAAALQLPSLIWIDNYFALNKDHRLIVSPYPDYRQLSNQRISNLMEIMKNFN